MISACALDKARQVLRHVSARSEKYRHHADRGGAFGDQCGDRLGERWLHQLEESELYRLPCFACQRGGELLERLRPLAAARAVREKDDGGAQRLCDGESSAAIQ